MKPVLAIALVLGLGACQPLLASLEYGKATVDRTLTACRTLDGKVVKEAIDLTAIDFEAEDALDQIRETRKAACARLGLIAILGEAIIPAGEDPAERE